MSMCVTYDGLADAIVTANATVTKWKYHTNKKKMAPDKKM